MWLLVSLSVGRGAALPPLTGLAFSHCQTMERGGGPLLVYVVGVDKNLMGTWDAMFTMRTIHRFLVQFEGLYI